MHQHWTAFENIVGKGEINCIPICPYFLHRKYAAELKDPKIGI